MLAHLSLPFGPRLLWWAFRFSEDWRIFSFKGHYGLYLGSESAREAAFMEEDWQTIGPFILVSALGLIVIVWTAIASSLFSLIRLYSINGTLTVIAISIAQVVLSFGVATLLLALIYKMIPEAKVHWRDVIVAAIVTGTAFTVTNYIFGTYIQTFTVTTLIGTGGTLVIILLWIFVLNQIVLFGAELSKVFAINAGEHATQHLLESLER